MIKSIWVVAVFAVAVAGCSRRNPIGRTASINPAPTPQDVSPGEELDDIDQLEDELEGETKAVADPLEKWNRGVFVVNDALYVWVARPVLKGYKSIAPEPVRLGIRNTFDNIDTPRRAINCLLQGKGNAAGTELHRFLINTTVGILGIRDAAAENYEIEAPPAEDFGQTLAVWGLGDGWYLVWPVLGPSTLRDSGGEVGDYFLDPVTYVQPWPVRLGVSGLRGVNKGSFSMEEYDSLRSEAIDPYAAMRDGYTQYRSAQIKK